MMRDEIDGRLWSAHHEAFDEAVDDLLARLKLAFRRLVSWDGSVTHLGTLLLSLAIATFTFKTTAI